MLNVGDNISVEIKRLGINGEGIGYYNRLAIFIPGGIPGERCDVEITSVSEKMAYAKIIDIKNVSKDRCEPKCPVYKECGGCQFLHTTYEHELKIKTDYMKDLFKTSRSVKIADVIPMDNPYSYRDKCQMTYKLSKSKKVVCGFYEEKSHKIVPITNCMIQSDKATAIIDGIKNILSKNLPKQSANSAVDSNIASVAGNLIGGLFGK